MLNSVEVRLMCLRLECGYVMVPLHLTCLHCLLHIFFIVSFKIRLLVPCGGLKSPGFDQRGWGGGVTFLGKAGRYFLSGWGEAEPSLY